MWLRLLIILNFSFLIFNCHSYGQRPIGIAFYDVDRIYDTVPALFYDDADYTPEGRLHWTAERYARKIRNTAAVIDSMALPLVALWGVENEQVVRDIAAACRGDYSYLHRTLNSLDGMDFALLYYGDLFYPVYDESGRGYLYVEGELGRDTVGLGLCFVQRYFHVVRLSSEGYLLSEVPISLGWGWWLALNAGFVAAIVALLVIPTAVVSGVKPEETIRYE